LKEQGCLPPSPFAEREGEIQELQAHGRERARG